MASSLAREGATFLEEVIISAPWLWRFVACGWMVTDVVEGEVVVDRFIRLVRMFLQPTATSNICRLSAAAMMRVKLCFPGGSFPLYTMSRRQENSWFETTVVSMEMLSEPSNRDLREGK